MSGWEYVRLAAAVVVTIAVTVAIMGVFFFDWLIVQQMFRDGVVKTALDWFILIGNGILMTLGTIAIAFFALLRTRAGKLTI